MNDYKNIKAFVPMILKVNFLSDDRFFCWLINLFLLVTSFLGSEWILQGENLRMMKYAKLFKSKSRLPRWNP